MADVSKKRILPSRFDNLLVYAAAVVVLLAVGVGIFVYLVYTKEENRDTPPKDTGALVRVCRVQSDRHRVAVTAYGTTRASEQWTAIAEVRGRAVEVNPRFEPGELLMAGEPLVTIDRTDYDLAVKQLEAETLAKRLALEELDQTEANLKEILKPQEHQRTLARAEYLRQKKAFDQGAVSQSLLESAASAYETSLTAVLTTGNELSLMSVRRKLTGASLTAVDSQLERARRDLDKCQIVLPMDARCASKSIELQQYASVGGPLGTFLALDTAEVVAMFETRKVPLIFPASIRDMKVLDLTDMTRDESFWNQIQIPVEVSWALGDRRPTWWGRVSRIASALDPGTRTVPVIVEVRDPYKRVQPGVRPPLIPDVFCEVTAYGATLDDVIVIPREAMRDGRVYLLKPSPTEENGQSEHTNGTLHIVDVNVVALEEDMAVIRQDPSTFKSGDLLILADLFPAAEGMLLRGELTKSTVLSRTAIEVPVGLFDDVKAAAAAEADTEARP